MSKILFLPVGLLGGLVAKKVFDLVWGLIDDEEAPAPEHRDVAWVKLVLALLVEGAIFRAVRGVIERGLRIGIFRTTGSWLGEDEPDPA